ncbi:hypothetical protein [Trinickia fusca]|nr:hypothetical protein [Trinickia fusca]
MQSSRSAAKSSRLMALVRRYESRQGVERIGAQYQPAIKAVRGEAPSLSRCSQILSVRLQRSVHALSTTEAAATVVALHCPALVDLQEQRCLPLEPARNPASLYEDASFDLLWLPGTIRVAERLELTKYQPRFVAEDAQGAYHVPVPLVGDLLLILRDAVGAYGVNWTVKLTEESFGEQQGLRPLRRRSPESVMRARARHQIEEVCYQEGGIPTHRVTRTTFDPTLVDNLRMLLPWDSRGAGLQQSQREEMVDAFRGIVGTECAPLDLLEDLGKQFRCERQDCLVVLYQAIWRRQLVVDLFKPVLVNVPLRPERTNPFDRYAQLFVRGAK